MNLARRFTLASALALTTTLPAIAGVTVNNPSNNTDVTSPFTLNASASTCSSSSVVTMGYSFDSSSDTTVIKGQSIDTSISSSTGGHTLHVKAWGQNGASCVTSISITIKAGSTSGESIIPSTADIVSHIQALSGWQAVHDSGGPGSSSGSTAIVSSPALYGSTRKYSASFSNNGDVRFSKSFSDNVDAKNLFYDAWVYLTSSSSKIGNLEFDVNQVMPNGQTALIGFQCDGYSGEWAYNVNKGSAGSPKPAWVSKSGTHCNPRSWSINKWHHVQASFYRSSTGTVTYHSVWLDGVQTTLNTQAFVAADLGWAPVVNTQFQIDGIGSGSVTAYVDNLTVSMW
ncbi:MAG TPA: hypothetical protein VK574_00285 [Terracidiphilus sp.]|nr:hypothetical protein [Terracidiphilus sp.]